MHRSLKIAVLIVVSVVSIFISVKVLGIFDIMESVELAQKQLQETHLSRFDPSIPNLPITIEITAAGKHIAIDDQTTIKKFLELVHDGTEVRAHHSHPEGEIAITLTVWPDVYLVGHDSANRNEFWLKLSPPGARPSFEPTIYHFQSLGISEWLTKIAERLARVK